MNNITITPLDIQNKTFKKGFRGYSDIDVDSFIEKVRIDYEKLYKQNAELKEELEEYKDKIAQYENIEDTLKQTLILAQETSEEVKKNAEKEKDMKLKEAEEQAKKLIQSANLKVIDVNREYEEAKKQLNIFRTRFETFLKAQLEMIDSGDWLKNDDYDDKNDQNIESSKEDENDD